MNSIPEIKYLKSFVLYTLIAMIFGAIMGGILGGILGAILITSGIDIKTIQTITGITGFILGSIVSFFVFRWIIQTQIIPQISKHYDVTNEDEGSEQSELGNR